MTGVGGLRRAASSEGDQGHRQPARRRGRSARRRRRARPVLVRRALLHRDRAVRSPPREAAPRAAKRSASTTSASARRTTCTTRTSGSRCASGADAICEKPLVINPWNLDALAGARARDRPARLHGAAAAPASRADRAARAPARRSRAQLHEVSPDLRAPRAGRWYDVSWKGSDERSGGLVTNIGIHFFDLLLWLFGPVVELRGAPARAERGWPATSSSSARACAGSCRPTSPICRSTPEPGVRTTFRSITVDGAEVEFSDGFADLHTRVYEEVLAGRGFGIDDARPSIELVAPHPARQPSTPRAAAPSTRARPPRDERRRRLLRPRVRATSTRAASIGDGTKIWHFSHVMTGATIGRALQHRPERRHLAARS